MKKVLLFIWQLPQNCIGYILTKILRCEEFYFISGYIKYYQATRFNDSWSGVSLGNYIIIASERYAARNTLRHEYGHQLQSRYLGWLYLLLIGLPSFLGNILHRFIKFDYYRQPWEKWADKLGNVRR